MFSLDLTYLRSFCDGDEAFVKEMLATLLEKVPAELQGLQDGLAREDWPTAYKAAHGLKSSLHLMGVTGIQDDIKALEACASKQESMAKAQSLAPKVLEAGWKGIEELKRLLEQ
jgi:HPt (histidine-containing phosphotransfer) domain-containing protein